MSDHVIVTDDGPVRTVRMNRPDKKNALTAAMYDAMAEALESANGDAGDPLRGDRGRARRVLGRQRPAGVLRRPPRPAKAWRSPVVRFLHALARSEQPLVAAVQGIAVGVGTTMLFHCDHVVAGDRRALLDAVRQPRPCAGGRLEPARPAPDGTPARLRAAGHGPAARRRAAQAGGLVNAVVPPDDVDAEAHEGRARDRRAAAEAVAASRRLMRGSPDEIIARIDEEVACSRSGCSRRKRKQPSKHS